MFQRFYFAFLVATLGAKAAYGGDALSDYIQRFRLTETSITETGKLSGYFDSIKLKTVGYGFTLIHPSGIGASYTFLESKGDGSIDETATDILLKHRYIDVNYTYGDRFIITGGAGLGVSGAAEISKAALDQQATWSDSKSLSLGPGFSVGWFEVYWIYRNNWATYRAGSERHVLASKHYQLGLGVHF